MQQSLQETAMSQSPRNIPEYLQQLRDALRGADPALVQDALYDAEDHLRSEMAARPGVDEAALLREVASSYGAPAEVAEIYTAREQQVELALHTRTPLQQAVVATATPTAPGAVGVPAPAARVVAAGPIAQASASRRFFGVVLEPRTYGALFFMLLALPIGIFHFTWAVTGVSLSIGLAILIIGIPFVIAFAATIYALSLVEGRLIEALLGERMPRRAAPPPREATMGERIKAVLSDGRTWSTLLYMVLRLPLGIAYFTVTVALLATALGLVLGSIMQIADAFGLLWISGNVNFGLPGWTAPLVLALGVLLFFATLHVARGLGRMHAAIAKSMLVRLPREG